MNLIVITTLVAQLVKNLSAMQETWVRSLGWEDSWERERLPISVFWPREFHGLYSSWSHKQLDMTERLSLHFFFTTSQQSEWPSSKYLHSTMLGRVWRKWNPPTLWKCKELKTVEISTLNWKSITKIRKILKYFKQKWENQYFELNDD